MTFATDLTNPTCAALTAAALALGTLVSQAQESGDAGRGLAFAQLTCASCHAVRGNVGPPNSAAPGFSEIAAVPGMTAIALNAALQTSHKTMPNLIIAPGDRADVVAYILSLRRK